MLNDIQGVLVSKDSPKQGGDKDQQPNTKTDQKEPSESKEIVRDKRDKELDDIHSLWKKLEAEDAKAKNEKMVLETKKSLITCWSMKYIQKERSNHILDEFTLVDLPFLNQYDWISLFHIVTKEEKKYEPIVAHFLKRMLICYIQEIAKMDVEITSVLKKKPILKLEEQLKDS
ncbi:unnamed protein product [Lactuca saligna]|uniref:Uncharacterized protein n=1 Tax=Lactuca saligna TaxID=75948 RepID=A0AA35VXI0_LACSI|nr:unnamed protein product [Lactuca saligna]